MFGQKRLIWSQCWTDSTQFLPMKCWKSLTKLRLNVAQTNANLAEGYRGNGERGEWFWEISHSTSQHFLDNFQSEMLFWKSLRASEKITENLWELFGPLPLCPLPLYLSIYENRTIQIAAQRVQGLWGPICVLREIWLPDSNRGHNSRSDSAITIARFHPSKLAAPVLLKWPIWAHLCYSVFDSVSDLLDNC